MKEEFTIEEVIEAIKAKKRSEYDTKFFRKLVLVSILPAAVVTTKLLGNEVPSNINAMSYIFNGMQILYLGDYACELYKRYDEDHGKQKTIGGLNRWE